MDRALLAIVRSEVDDRSPQPPTAARTLLPSTAASTSPEIAPSSIGSTTALAAAGVATANPVDMLTPAGEEPDGASKAGDTSSVAEALPLKNLTSISAAASSGGGRDHPTASISAGATAVGLQQQQQQQTPNQTARADPTLPTLQHRAPPATASQTEGSASLSSITGGSAIPSLPIPGSVASTAPVAAGKGPALARSGGSGGEAEKRALERAWDLYLQVRTYIRNVGCDHFASKCSDFANLDPFRINTKLSSHGLPTVTTCQHA